MRNNKVFCFDTNKNVKNEQKTERKESCADDCDRHAKIVSQVLCYESIIASLFKTNRLP